ncbi:MAG: hypothetical protein JST92_24015 [Deltaproteobacteria bacterium]|nr:hypothetical protein [Deltaproteobacteria bacterium]
MKSQLALALSMLAAVSLACGGSSNVSGDPATRSRNALPSQDSVAIGSPKSTSGSLKNPNGGAQDSTVGDASVWAATTATLAFDVNGSVIWALSLVKAISDLPPTSCTDTGCVWGPGSSALDTANYKLTVNFDASTGVYTWALSGESKANPGSGFTAVLSGTAQPSAIPHRGTGHFTIDNDAARALNPNNTDIGRLEIDYDNTTAGAGSIDVSFLGVKDNDHPGQTLNILYAYEEQQGGGDLDVATHNTTSGDRLAIHSRWLATGSGRADVKVSIAGGAGSAYTATGSECWAAATFKVTYFATDDNAHLGADSGVETNCSFAAAAFSNTQAP